MQLDPKAARLFPKRRGANETARVIAEEDDEAMKLYLLFLRPNRRIISHSLTF